jgi:ankyrin repeat protein
MNISLHGACSVGELLPSDLDQIKALLADNPGLVSSKDPKGQTPLHLAAVHANKAMLKLLLANGADVNAKGEHGLTPLHGVAGLDGARFMFLA